MNPQVAIIIVNFNNPVDTLDCLASCLQLQYPHFHIWLVDNGSTDLSWSRLQAAYGHHPQVSLLNAGQNLGFAGGCNLGIERALQAGSDLIWLLNNDAVAHPQALQHLVRATRDHPDAGLFGSRIYFADPPDQLWFAGGKVVAGNNHDLGHRETDLGQYDHLAEVDYVNGCSLLIRTQVIRQIGPMATHYFLYWEELDWCHRARRAGWSCRMVPQSVVWHRGNATTGKQPLLQIRYHTRNQLHYLWAFDRRRVGLQLLRNLQRGTYPASRTPQQARAILQGTLDFLRGSRGQLPFRSPGYNVFGIPRGNTGLANATRQAFQLLQQLQIPHSIREADRYTIRGQPEGAAVFTTDHHAWRLHHAINLFHLNPAQITQILPPSWPFLPYEQKFNAIVPFWELPVLPADWIQVLSQMDAILAPTKYLQQIYQNQLPQIPVLHYPQAFHPPGPVAANRARYGLPDDHHIFLVAFDMTSDIERKNPWGAIEAFQKAFEPDEPVMLVIKVNNPHHLEEMIPLYQQLVQRVALDPRIRLLDQPYSYTEALEIFASCDTLVSLHRAEGLGLVLMECMALGKSVIATAWSGNMDYCTEQNCALVGYDLVPVRPSLAIYQLSQSSGAQWAQPRPEEASRWMRQLVDQPSLGHQLGQQAARDMVTWSTQDRSAVFEQLEALYYSDRWWYRKRPVQHWLLSLRLRSIPRHLAWRWPRLAATLRALGIRRRAPR